MVYYNKISQNKCSNMSKLEKEKESQYKELIEKNTFYITKTLLDCNYNGTTKDVEREVKLFRRVRTDGIVEIPIILSFGESIEYCFNSDFVNRFYLNSSLNYKYRLCIDFEHRLYVKNEEVKRILFECVESLSKSNSMCKHLKRYESLLDIKTYCDKYPELGQDFDCSVCLLGKDSIALVRGKKDELQF